MICLFLETTDVSLTGFTEFTVHVYTGCLSPFLSFSLSNCFGFILSDQKLQSLFITVGLIIVGSKNTFGSLEGCTITAS